MTEALARLSGLLAEEDSTDIVTAADAEDVTGFCVADSVVPKSESETSEVVADCTVSVSASVTAGSEAVVTEDAEVALVGRLPSATEVSGFEAEIVVLLASVVILDAGLSKVDEVSLNAAVDNDASKAPVMLASTSELPETSKLVLSVRLRSAFAVLS